MIIISADVPFSAIKMSKLESIVNPLWTLEISKVDSSIEDEVSKLSYESLNLRLTTHHIDFGLRMENRISLLEVNRCEFDLVSHVVREMMNTLTIHQRAAWDYYNRQRV